MNILGNPLIDLEGLNTFKGEIEKEIAENNGSLTEAINASRTVGGIASGSVYPKDTDYETIFRDMLNPTEAPTLTNPSAALTVAGGTLLESGSSVEKTFTVEFNRGRISPANGTSGYRAGVATSYALNNGTAQNSGTFIKTVTEDNKTFKATVNYEAGEQPKNNKGENYSSPLPAGSVNSNTITFEFVDAIWTNAADNTKVEKEELVSKLSKSKSFVMAPQTASSPEVLDFPATWQIEKVEVLNELSNKYESCIDEFEVLTTTHKNAGGVDVSYNRYQDRRNYSAGKRTLKVTWK